MSRLPEHIRTARLAIRLVEAADAEALNAAIVQSHPELQLWMDWAVEPQTLEETRAFCGRSLENWKSESEFNAVMIELETGEIIGSCGYPRLDWTVPRFEIGYWCRSDRVGRGYVSEATWALATHAFRELEAARVELRMDDRNTRSWRVAERLGFHWEGTLRNDVRVPDGTLRDTRVYAVTALDALTAPEAAERVR